VALGRFGPWVVTTSAHARQVLTEPGHYDFPSDVSREKLTSNRETSTPQRSHHTITPPLDRAAVARGEALFRAELERVTGGWAESAVFDAMQVLRQPVARSTTAAVLPELSESERNEVGDLVVGWIDALGPVIASSWGP
jgi:hypothetical protein